MAVLLDEKRVALRARSHTVWPGTYPAWREISAWHWMPLSTTTGDCRIPMSGYDSCRNSPGLISTRSASRPRKRSYRSCNSWSSAEESESNLSSYSLVVADERYLCYIPPQRLSCNPHMYTPISPQNPVCSLCRKMLGIGGTPFLSPGGCPDTPGALVLGRAEPRRVPSHNQEEGNSTRTAVRIAVPVS